MLSTNCFCDRVLKYKELCASKRLLEDKGILSKVFSFTFCTECVPIFSLTIEIYT